MIPYSSYSKASDSLNLSHPVSMETKTDNVYHLLITCQVLCLLTSYFIIATVQIKYYFQIRLREVRKYTKSMGACQ